MNYRLGLDVGTNSLGWSVLELDENGEVVKIKAAGSRIFSDGRDSKSKATLAADRRDARSARRRRDRYKQRRAYLLSALTDAGLFPKNEDVRAALQKLNPLELRARLLTEPAQAVLTDIQKQKDAGGEAANHPDMKPEYLIGRALFHLNQRRGFQSNRKDRSEETTSGKVSKSVRMLLKEMNLIAAPIPDEEYKELSKEGKKLARQGEAQARKDALSKLAEQKDLSFGSFLYDRQKVGKQTRARPGAGDDGKLYDVYPSRELYQDEFNKIWDKQAPAFSQEMADKAHFYEIIFTQRPLKPQKRGKCTYMSKHDRTFRAMPSFQQYRMYQDVNNLGWATAQGRHYLTDYPEARDAIIDLLEKPPTKATGEIAPNKQIVWGHMKKILKKKGIIEGNIEFNFESEKRKGFDSNLTSNIMQHEDYVGPDWHKWDLEKQDRFIDVILDDGLDDDVQEYLMLEYGLDETAADNCMTAPLAEGMASVSKEAAKLMLEKMRDGIGNEERPFLPIQSVAAEAVAKERDDFENPMRRPKTSEAEFKPRPHLPYYGKWFHRDGRHIIPGTKEKKDKHDDRKYYGGVTNPTVHIAMNQIRQVVNQLIDRFGHPDSIAIELGRELPAGAEKRNKIESEQKKNQEKNERLDKILLEQGQDPNRGNRLRLELWEELGENPTDRSCPFSGKTIGIADLFNGEAEIEHLIPFSISLDDSKANKVICTRKANRDKGQNPPFQAFGRSPEGYIWDEIFERAKNLPKSKQWRFQENALKIWQGDSEEIEKAAQEMAASDSDIVKSIGKQILTKGVGSLSGEQKKIAEDHGIPRPDFSPRHLNDTRYIGRLAREYLEAVCRINKIDVLTGRLTALLRGHWGLNNILKELHDESEYPRDHNRPEGEQDETSAKKNRDDHRHHAIDAIVIGMTNRSTLQKVATEANKRETNTPDLHRLFPKTKNGRSVIDPWDGFRNDVKELARNITVSHKAKRGLQGQLHKEFTYGIADEKIRNKLASSDKTIPIKTKVVLRRAIDDFSSKKHVLEIRDKSLKEAFLAAFDAEGKDGFIKLAKDRGIRHLRVEFERTVQPIRDEEGKAYKAFWLRGNWATEIYEIPKKDRKTGQWTKEWKGKTISRFEANNSDFDVNNIRKRLPHPAARFVMRLHSDDFVEIDGQGKKRIMRVQKMSGGGVYICEHQEANVADRLKELVDNGIAINASASRLQKLKARKVHISPTGQVNYETRYETRRRKRRKG